MAGQAPDPLDERVFNHQGVIDWWVSLGGKPMDENMIHRYLQASPFFDHTTKNGLFFGQADNTQDPRALEIISNRAELEEALRRQVGTEYMVAETPQAAQGEGAQWGLPANSTGIYVLRKQDRQRVEGYDGRMHEELTPLETYYTVNQALFRAASVADTVGSRLLSAQKHLRAFAEAAGRLPSFDPAMGGYYYLGPSSKPANAPGAGSREASPARSREGSVVAGADGQSVRSGSVELGGQTAGDANAAGAAALEDRLLRESLGMSVQFGEEFMDENPIIGEPGKFSFTSSTAAVKKRKADEEAAAAKAKAEREAKAGAAAAKAEKAPAPAPPTIMMEGKAGSGKSEKEREKDRRGSRMGEKARRKKSKGSALSPTTPGAGSSSLS